MGLNGVILAILAQSHQVLCFHYFVHFLSSTLQLFKLIIWHLVLDNIHSEKMVLKLASSDAPALSGEAENEPCLHYLIAAVYWISSAISITTAPHLYSYQPRGLITLLGLCGLMFNYGSFHCFLFACRCKWQNWMCFILKYYEPKTII